MLERDLDRDIVTYYLHLLNLECSEVPFNENSFHIETGYFQINLLVPV